MKKLRVAVSRLVRQETTLDIEVSDSADLEVINQRLHTLISGFEGGELADALFGAGLVDEDYDDLVDWDILQEDLGEYEYLGLAEVELAKEEDY